MRSAELQFKSKKFLFDPRRVIHYFTKPICYHMNMYKIINDQFKKARGGKTHILDISCGNCGSHISFYQKDGPGLLMRMYIDRFIDFQPDGNDLACSSCLRILGNKIIFEKENRPAYRLYVGAATTKLVSAKSVTV